MSLPSISLAMCTYNGGRYLEQQLESIERQIRPPDEIVICDDVSTDGTPDILQAFAARTSVPVRLVTNTSRLGMVPNFSKAIGLCAGDVIALADQDDVWHSHKLARLESAFLVDPSPGLVFSDGDLIDDAGGSRPGSCWEAVSLAAEQVDRIAGGDAFATLLRRQHDYGGTITGCTMAFLSSYRDLVLPIAPELPTSSKGLVHDGWVALLVAAVARVAPIRERLIRYRQHATQTVGFGGPPQSRLRALGLRRVAGTQEETSAGEPDELRWMKALQERLECNAGGYPLDAARALVSAKVDHLSARAALPTSRVRRVPGISRELRSRRYQVHSSGLRSAVADLLR